MENSGTSRVRFNDDLHQYPGGDWGVVIVCDGQLFGRFYICHDATGVIYGTLAKGR